MANKHQLITKTLTVGPTASAATHGDAFELPLQFDTVKVIAELASHTGGTLDVYLQHSPDGGTTWFDCAHFAQVSAASTLVKDLSLVLDGTHRTVGKGNKSTTPSGLAADSHVSAPWSPKLRIAAITGAGTSGADKVQTIHFILQDTTD